MVGFVAWHTVDSADTIFVILLGLELGQGVQTQITLVPGTKANGPVGAVCIGLAMGYLLL